jgi:hypothetical protein
VLSRRFNIDNEATFVIKVQSPSSSVARKYARRLNINRLGNSNVITINMRDENARKAINIIETLIGVYNKSVIEKKMSPEKKH